MLVHLTLMLSLTTASQAEWQTDTTFAVPAGTRLELQNVTGNVTISAWNRSDVRVRADHGRRSSVAIELTGSNLRLRPQSDRGIMNLGGIADYHLTIPVSMAIQISGMHADVTIEGTRSDIKVQTVSGDIAVTGGDGTLALTTIDGMISVRDGAGRLEATTTSDDVVVDGFRGGIRVEAVSGDISLRRVDSRDVFAEAVSGEVEYEGTVRDDGTYLFSTHSGDLVVAIPENANVLIRAVASMGDVESTFTLPTAARSGRRERSYRLGTGSASMELKVFSGDVRLVRPSEIRSRNDDEEN